MRPVDAISGGVSKFAKARPDKTFQPVIKEAYDYAIADRGLDFPTFARRVAASIAALAGLGRDSSQAAFSAQFQIEADGRVFFA